MRAQMPQARRQVAEVRVLTLGRTFSDRDVVSPRLPALLEADFELMLPLVRWLNAALGLRPAARR